MSTGLFINVGHLSKRNKQGEKIWEVDFEDPEWYLKVADFERKAHPNNSLLGKQECKVLTLLSQGWGREEVAKELCVSVNTVRSHCQHILRKLAARNRAHAVAIAIRRGIL